ncbi:MAG: serine hydrolase [Phycisphaerales bacterium]
MSKHARRKWWGSAVWASVCAIVATQLAVALPAPPPNQKQMEAESARMFPPSAKARKVKIPDSKVGDQLRWVIKAINSGDVSDAEQHCEEDLLSFVSKDEMKTIFKEIREEAFGGEDVFAVKASVEERGDSMVAEITSESGKNALDVFLAIDDKSAKLSSLRFASSGGASGGGDAGDGGGGDGRDSGNGDWDAFSDMLKDLGGDTAFAAYEMMPPPPGEDGVDPTRPWELLPIAAKSEEKPMAINMISMLYLLAALGDEVEAGKATWDEKLTIEDRFKSLPSGTMQLEEPGKQFPLRDFAIKMITLSDHTAADHILNRLGREHMQEYIAAINDNTVRNTPYLYTREFFALKLGAPEEVRTDYVDADDDDQLTMLSKGGDAFNVLQERGNVLETLGPALGDWLEPVSVDSIGWYATPKQCCELMAKLHAMELRKGMEPIADSLRHNPGIGLDEEKWKTVAFKGSSGEPGVQTGVWMLERADGKWFVMAVLWNHRAKNLDNEKFMQVVYKGISLFESDGKVVEVPADQPARKRPAKRGTGDE